MFTVEKPRHVDFNDFNITWHKGDGLLMLNKTWQVEEPKRPRKSLDSRRSSLGTVYSAKSVVNPYAITADDLLPQCPLFVVTFTLPDYLCYWGTPVACHYETVEEIVQEAATDDIPIDRHKSRELFKRPVIDENASTFMQFSENSSLFSQSRLSIMAYAQPKRSTIQFTENVLKVHKKNRYRSRSNFFSQSSSHVGWSATPQYAVNVSDGKAFVRDFRFNFPLTIPQIRYMERTCVPRLLSSYKFPKEIRDEEMAIMQGRSKGKGGTIIRKQVIASDETTDQANRLFTFDSDQNNPERLFVVFPSEDPARIADHIKPFASELPCEPETFLHLMCILNLIKRNFQFSLRHILDLPNFRSKTDFFVHRRRIKDKALKKEKKDPPKDPEIIYDLGKRASTATRYSRRMSRMMLKSSHSMKSSVRLAPESNSFVYVENQEDEDEREQPVEMKEEEEKTPVEVIQYSHWTTAHIRRYNFDREKRQFTIVTDRLGGFSIKFPLQGCPLTLSKSILGYLGFAFNRYEHFPFRNWEMVPSERE